MIEGESHPFAMDRDGTNKRDLTKGTKGFAYGFNAAPDGKRVAYHKDYQVYLADADGSSARRVETSHPFNFCPTWSPDGAAVQFLSGEHYACHPYLVRADGTGLRKLADRGGYRGSSSSWTCPTSTAAAATCPSGLPTASPSSTRPWWAAEWSCSGRARTGRVSG